MTTRMRTLPQAIKMLDADDPGNQLKISGLRKLVASGEIPSVVIGRYKMINFDALLELLNSKKI